MSGSDAALRDAQRAYDAGSIPIWDLRAVERLHLDAQSPIGLDVMPRRGMVVIDREGDAWRYGNSRWTCLTPIDGRHIRNVARLPHAPVVRTYGPLRLIGVRGEYFYRTIRGRSD
ncbi:hypothetical protein [Curtobacterium sp. MCLR17_042]|uniref:hypothetical protein n=1 Tax=Curtobacterium sp. MCLR17_042 TaxID=2175626 RepID=UPI000DAA4409|nr:hypothetical protein [Curtobacterium sp. MCLR17_042]PZE28373.1 hypothetical protein DEJ02_07875 [Curtobacterium sp. MCLR17_042]